MKYFIILILLLLLGYILYASFIFIPLNTYTIIFSHFPNQLSVNTNQGYQFYLWKALPKNTMITFFPTQEQEFSFQYNQGIPFLDKEISLLKYHILLHYQINRKDLKKLYLQFKSGEEIHSHLKEKIKGILTERIHRAIENSENLNRMTDNLSSFLFMQIQNQYEGLTIKKLEIQRENIIPDLNYKKMVQLINQTMDQEQKFILNLHMLELEKMKLVKVAENEVASLRVVGEYIKENPLILKYILVKNLNKNSVFHFSSSEVGFDFSSSLQEKVIQKIENKTNEKSY